MKKRKPGRPKGTVKEATERLPWRFPEAWGLREKIEAIAQASGEKPINVLAKAFNISVDEQALD